MIEQLKRNLKCNIVSIYIKTTDKQREERLRIRGSSKEEIEEKLLEIIYTKKLKKNMRIL